MVPDILTIGKLIMMGNGFPVSGMVTTPSVNDLHEKKAPPHYNTVSTQSQSTHTMPYHLYMHVLTYTIVHTVVPTESSCIDIYLRIHIHHSCTECSCVSAFLVFHLRLTLCALHTLYHS